MLVYQRVTSNEYMVWGVDIHLPAVLVFKGTASRYDFYKLIRLNASVSIRGSANTKQELLVLQQKI